MKDAKKEHKKIEVITGNGSELEISPVYDTLNGRKPNSEKPKNIVVPKEKDKDNLDNNDSTEDNNNS